MTNKTSSDDNKRTLSVRSVNVAFLMLTINVVVLIAAPLLGFGEFNPTVFLVMFTGMTIGYAVTLYTKANYAPPIPKKPTQLVSNILMAVSDVIANRLIKETPATTEFKDRLIKLVEWELREAQTTELFDQDILLEAKSYIHKKIYGDNSE